MSDPDMIKEMLCSFLDRGLVGLPAKVMFTFRENTTNLIVIDYFFPNPSVFFGSLIFITENHLLCGGACFKILVVFLDFHASLLKISNNLLTF